MTETLREPFVGEASHPEDVAETVAENHKLQTPEFRGLSHVAFLEPENSGAGVLAAALGARLAFPPAN